MMPAKNHSSTLLSKHQKEVLIGRIKASVTFTVEDSVKVLEIYWDEAESPSRYTVEWLMNEHQEAVTNDGQRVNYNLIKDDLKILDLKVNSDSVTIVLSNETEVTFTCESLLINSDRRVKTAWNDALPSFTNVQSPNAVVLDAEQAIPTFNYQTLIQDEVIRTQYILALKKYGITLVSGAPIDAKNPLKEDSIRQLCEITGGLQKTHYGDIIPQTLNVTLKNKDETYQSITGKEVVSEYGHPVYSNARLPLHCDFSFYDAMPGIAFLECVEYENVVSAGGTVFVDGIEIVNKFKVSHPESFQTLCQLPVVFSSDRRKNPKRPVCYQVQKPVLSVNYYGDLEELRWEQTNYHLSNLVPEDTQRLLTALSDFRNFCTAIEDEEKMGHLVHWQPGDTVVWNNRRMLHYRPEYNVAPNAKRSHLLAYSNHMDFLSLTNIKGGNVQ